MTTNILRRWTLAAVLFALMNVQLSVASGTHGFSVAWGVSIASADEDPCKDPLINKDCEKKLYLMQPLDDTTHELPTTSGPLDSFFLYFNMSWPWLLGVASGIAVLQAVWGGILIMTSIDNEGGKSKIEWALGGMVMIALAGFILRFLNPIFYA